MSSRRKAWEKGPVNYFRTEPAEGPLAECRNGIHAIEVEHLAQWFGPRLWVRELRGEELPVLYGKHCAREGRMVREIPIPDETIIAFAEVCAARVAMWAAAAARDAAASAEQIWQSQWLCLALSLSENEPDEE